MLNKEIEKQLLKKLIDLGKLDIINEDDLISDEAKQFYKLIVKYHGNEQEVIGAVLGTNIEDYGVDIIGMLPVQTEVKHLIKDLKEEQRKMRMIDIQKQIMLEQDIDKVKALLENVPQFPEEENLEDFNEVVDNVVMAILGEGEPIKKISTGYQSIDEVIDGGFYPGTLNIVAGKPGTGKSAFSLCLFNNQVLKQGYYGVYFSLEMGRKEVLQRIFSNQTGIEFSKIRSGNGVEEGLDKISNCMENIKKARIDIIDNLFKFNNICAKIRELSKEGLDIAYIDYLGLMEAKGDNRYMQISGMTRVLKELSRECNIPIVLLSQLNRSDSARGDKAPLLSDLRDSGSIEQDADSVFMLYRPDEESKELEIYIRKNRNGPSDVCINCLSDYKYMNLKEKIGF